MKIIVAEDDPVSRRVLEAVLNRMGHECESAEDGESAWAHFKAAVPDVLITDWMMPGMAGPDLCRHVRAAYGPDCYVIMLTALSGDNEIRTAIEAGADDFLNKPLDRNQLTMRLAVADRLRALRLKVAELDGKA
ncbi:response regulator [Solirubrobacter sp. CPCC 204708]|uniref:Response regulator n=1 Tax=Solirubrobacter deserti TaxID=2282478 RepID=A0ABT4RCV3_9ACTN|nr:response regulator [Solirubrobacter deserti]MBE2317862.1 response regulator [Solirubrobacter deserti]MDA0136361.1 response regulator [Solirubrobacter deserti]